MIRMCSHTGWDQIRCPSHTRCVVCTTSAQVRHIGQILSEPGSSTWTQRWLEVLKGDIASAAQQAAHGPQRHNRASVGGTLGDESTKTVSVPQFGFGDPKSYAIMASMVHRLAASGAVRHGAECFNFWFPQELDSEYLIVWNGWAGVPWRKVPSAELQGFLLARIAEGYAFPLNPKWILCDPGWYTIYEAMVASTDARPALDSWLPPHSVRLRAPHDT